MTREQFQGLLKAAEHNLELRRELKNCDSNTEIPRIASKYGFSVSQNDICDDEECSKLEEWFETSRISPLKKS